MAGIIAVYGLVVSVLIVGGRRFPFLLQREWVKADLFE